MENKHMKKIDKIDVITFIICLILGISSTLTIEFNANDELWNFSNIYKMTNGYTIYKDLNVIITPLFFYIGEGLFKIFGSNFLVYRVYNILIETSFIYLVYVIFKELKIKKVVSSLCALIVGIAFIIPLSGVGANYNVLAMELFVLGMYLNLKINKNNKWSPWIQGIIAFLIFYTKQNIGIYYLAASFFMHLTYAIKEKEIKREIMQYIKQIITFLILCVIAVIPLYLKGNLYDFIDMCFLGIHDFATNNVGFDWARLIIILVSITGIAYSFMMIKLKNVDSRTKEMNFILLPYMVFAMIVMYPIFNIYHIYMATIPTIIFFVANTYKTFICEIISEDKMNKFCKYTIAIIAGIYILVLGINTYSYVRKIDIYVNPYYGANMSKKQLEQINEITEYITEKNKNGIDVKVVSFTSNVYMNVLNQNNGKLDLPFYGNFGSKGEQGVIDQIASLKKCKILIQKDDRIFFQESQKIRDYIKNNLEADGEIGDYLVYKK